jgi:predicted phosphate transport protein (TIGR00153 family)
MLIDRYTEGGDKMRLFGRKDEQLFALFKESARVVVRGGDILQDVVNDYRDLDIKMAKLTAMEHEGDRIIQDLVRRLNTSFILPFDREDAFRLVQKLSTTLDYITGIIDRMILYKAGQPDDMVKEMVQVLIETLKYQDQAFHLLDKVEKNKKEILECCEQIRKLERKQDNLYRNGLAALFEQVDDPVSIIKWREVYEQIEMAEDYLEDLSELISNICVKYS